MTDYQPFAWWALGMMTAFLIGVVTVAISQVQAKRRRAALPPPEAIRELATDLARLSRRINAYAAGREEERQHPAEDESRKVGTGIAGA